MSDAGLRVSEAAQLRWSDILDTDTDAGLVYIERSKTDQTGEGAYVAITAETLVALKRLRQDLGVMPDRDVSGIWAVDVADQQARGQHGKSHRPWGWLLESLWPRGPGYLDYAAGSSAAGGADARALEVAVNAGEVHQG